MVVKCVFCKAELKEIELNIKYPEVIGFYECNACKIKDWHFLKNKEREALLELNKQGFNGITFEEEQKARIAKFKAKKILTDYKDAKELLEFMETMERKAR